MFDITPGAPAPEEFYCPITGKIMLQSTVIADGTSCEKEAILAHFEQCQRANKPFTNPIDQTILDSNQNFPNKNLQKRIQKFLDDNPEYVSQLYVLKPTFADLLAGIKARQPLIVKNCLSDGELLHKKDEEGNTPLHLAASLGFQEIVQLLIEHGANYKLHNSNGQQADTLAQISGFPDLAKDIVHWHRAYKMVPILQPLQTKIQSLEEQNQSLKQDIEKLEAQAKGKEEACPVEQPSLSMKDLLPLGTLFKRLRLKSEPLLIAQLPLPLDSNNPELPHIIDLQTLSNGDLALLVAYGYPGQSKHGYEIQIWDNTPSNQAKKRVSLRTLEHASWAMEVLPDMQLAVVNSRDQQVDIISVEDGRVLKTFSSSGKAKNTYIALGHNNQLLVGRELGCIEIWDFQSGVRPFVINPLPKDLPYGNKVETLGIALISNQLIAMVIGPYQEGSSIYGQQKTCCQLQIFNLDTRKVHKSYKIPGDFLSIHTLSEDKVVTGHTSGAIYMWSVNNDLAPINLSGHLGAVTSLNNLPAGLLVSGSSDNTIRIWDTNTTICCHVFTDERACSNRTKENNLLGCYSPHEYGIKALQVLPNGELVSVSDFTYVKRWIIPELVLEQFCQETPGCKMM